jgi:hypothetical protein
LLGPFDPIVIAAGVAANLATVILQHHSQGLHDTRFGHLLSELGLITPSFTERLSAAIQAAVKRYFELHPNYRYQPVVNFLANKSTTQHVADSSFRGRETSSETDCGGLSCCS